MAAVVLLKPRGLPKTHSGKKQRHACRRDFANGSLQDVKTGLVWMTNILTDPFHDIKLYYRAPLHLLRVELIDPTHGAQAADRRHA